MSIHGADFWIRHLELTRHIEGGWYNEVYRSPLLLKNTQLPSYFPGTRNSCTHIYFLLQQHGFSAFHRIRSDELWHFYSGDALIVYEIDDSGQLTKHRLGNDPGKAESFFCVIKAGNWFASRVADGGDYTLVGCTVSPGFDFEDFELADKKMLLNVYPQHAELINELAIDI
ncbi:MAG TPA: cupin domain-containing protein [Chitinophagaceae bacterium]|nr:cupin domain-containing protein [Chitinophagaceae bacterium]